MKLRPGAPLSRSRSSSGRIYCAALVACGFTKVTESLTSTVVAITATANVTVCWMGASERTSTRTDWAANPSRPTCKR